MKLSTKVAHNTIIQFVSKIIATAMGLFIVAIMTRYLGKYGFGQQTTVITYLMFFATIADFGLTLITSQQLSIPGANQQKILDNLFTFRFVSATILLLLSIFVSLFLNYEPIVKIGIAVASLSFLFNALNQIFVGLFQKHLKTGKVAIAEVVSKIALLILVYAAAKLNYGLIGILIAVVISNGISFSLHYIFSRSIIKVKFEFDFKYWKTIISQSWPLALTIFFNLLYLKTDTLILSFVKSQSEVGIYGAAYKVIEVVSTLPFLFAGIILPILTNGWASKNFDFFKKVLQRAFDVLMILSIPMIVGTQVVAYDLMRIVAGKEFEISGAPLRILILAAFAIFFASIFAHAIIAIQKQKKMIGIYFFTAISSVLLYLFFIPKYSYIGAAWITVYSESLIAVASLWVLYKNTKFLPSLVSSAKALFSASLMGLFLYSFSDKLGLLLLVIFSGLIYFSVLYLIKGISKRDLLDILNKS